jgi:hypothetical protein
MLACVVGCHHQRPLLVKGCESWGVMMMELMNDLQS